MPTFSVATSIPAGQAVNILAGTQYEFIPFHAQLEIGAVTPLTGIVSTVYAGTDLLVQESVIVDLKPAGQLPIYPDNFHVADECAAGDRINITHRNTTASAATVITVVRYNPL